MTLRFDRKAQGSSFNRTIRARFKPLRPESQDLLHLDMLRILASIAVVITHFREALFAGLAIGPYLEDLVHSRLGLAVDMFFVISGFVIAWVYGQRITTKQSYARFLRKRIARLGPLHWATTAFYIAVGLLAVWIGISLDNPDRYQWSCLPSTLLLTQSWLACDDAFNSVAWSISTEMLMYLLFPLMLVMVRKAAVLVLAVVVAMVMVGILIPDAGSGMAFLNSAIRRGFQGFLLGLVLYRHRAIIACMPFPGTLMLLATAAFVAGSLLLVRAEMLVPLIYVIVIGAVARDMQNVSNRFVSLTAPLGQLTYSMYMLHPLVQSVVLTFVGKMVLNLSGVELSLWAVGAMAFTLVISYLSLMLFEEPLRRLMSGSSLRQQTSFEYVTAP